MGRKRDVDYNAGGALVKTAPVQSDGVLRQDLKGKFPYRIPWDLHVRAWQVYAAIGHGDQSAQRIAERGGFGLGEIYCLLCDHNLDGNPLNEHQKSRLAGYREDNCESL